MDKVKWPSSTNKQSYLSSGIFDHKEDQQNVARLIILWSTKANKSLFAE